MAAAAPTAESGEEGNGGGGSGRREEKNEGKAKGKGSSSKAGSSKGKDAALNKEEAISSLKTTMSDISTFVNTPPLLFIVKHLYFFLSFSLCDPTQRRALPPTPWWCSSLPSTNQRSSLKFTRLHSMRTRVRKFVRSRLQINTIFNLLLFSSTQTTRRAGPRSSSRAQCGVTCSRIGSTIWLCCAGT